MHPPTHTLTVGLVLILQVYTVTPRTCSSGIQCEDSGEIFDIFDGNVTDTESTEIIELSLVNKRSAVGSADQLSPRDSLPCQSTKEVVLLKHNENHYPSPLYIEVGKCGGICSNGGKCVSRKTRNEVISFHFTGVRILENKEFTEEEECFCACDEGKELDSESNTCKCKSDEKESCLAFGNHYYDEEICRCMCRTRRSRECSSGHEFNEEKCDCIYAGNK